MSNAQTVIGASLAGALAHVDDPYSAISLIAFAMLALACFDDPLPDAIQRGLEEFARKHRR